MKINLISLGCHKNLVDSENMLGILDKNENIEIVKDLKDAEVVIVNTCGFINDAKEEAINTIISVSEEKKQGKIKKIIVAGCLAQRYAEELLEELPEIDGIVGTGELDKIEEVINDSFENKKTVKTERLDFLADSETARIVSTYPHTAYLKIAEGCDNHCTYCIIPKLRGRYRSRTIEDIIKEAKKLAKKGVRELSIIAQDTTDYGLDIYGERALPKLLKEITKINGIDWIRVFYTYPNNFTEELIKVIKEEDKIVKYADIPIQHVSDRVLKRMNRQDTFESIKKKLNLIKKEIPNVVFRTSLIVGFPGETELEFEELKEFVKEFKFDYAGIFNYSREEGTVADKLDGHLSDEERHARWQELFDLQNEISDRKNIDFIGKEIEVIIDRESEEEEYLYEGRTRGQALDIDGIVFIDKGNAKIGEIVKVKIEDSFSYDLIGGIVENEYTK